MLYQFDLNLICHIYLDAVVGTKIGLGLVLDYTQLCFIDLNWALLV